VADIVQIIIKMSGQVIIFGVIACLVCGCSSINGCVQIYFVRLEAAELLRIENATQQAANGRSRPETSNSISPNPRDNYTYVQPMQQQQYMQQPMMNLPQEQKQYTMYMQQQPMQLQQQQRNSVYPSLPEQPPSTMYMVQPPPPIGMMSVPPQLQPQLPQQQQSSVTTIPLQLQQQPTLYPQPQTYGASFPTVGDQNQPTQ